MHTEASSGKKGWSRSARLLLLAPAAAAAYWALSHSPAGVERIYTPTYRPLAALGSRVTGAVPISCAEVILFVLVTSLAVYGMWRWRGIRSRRWSWRTVARCDTLRILASLSVIYVAFLLVWGINYHRLPFASLANLSPAPSHAAQLRPLCEALVKKANELRAEMEEDSAGVAVLQNSLEETLRRASIGFAVAGIRYPELAGNYGPAKAALFSPLLSWLGISGIYFPFTAEPHVNSTLPAPHLPFTACHEMAHQRGFAREDEANYLGYLACRLHPDSDFRYSGTLTAVLYAIRALPSGEAQTEVLGRLSDAVRRDLDAARKWRERYRSVASELSTRVNDAYLRANGQEDGVQSYGRMVDLMLAEWGMMQEDGDGKRSHSETQRRRDAETRRRKRGRGRLRQRGSYPGGQLSGRPPSTWM
jgi:hypothetical protein